MSVTAIPSSNPSQEQSQVDSSKVRIDNSTDQKTNQVSKSNFTQKLPTVNNDKKLEFFRTFVMPGPF